MNKGERMRTGLPRGSPRSVSRTLWSPARRGWLNRRLAEMVCRQKIEVERLLGQFRRCRIGQSLKASGMMKEMAEELKQLPTQKVQMVLENEENHEVERDAAMAGRDEMRARYGQIQPTTYCLTHIELSSSSALANIPCFLAQVKIVLLQRLMASDLHPSVTSRGNASPPMQISTSRRHFRSLNYRQTAKHLAMRSPFRRFRRQVHDLIVPL
ncbi:hypothetical protein FA95DRAFT_826931 [Auriscalpium vulgare]|uniref:Uncharacterized protein n=1 Tax=Auriscalpium vulgare TaxID=40419 RepID=A0ACB8RAY2_9AGAM|nr:hypothetical protein FA95DRAFT_826931 [Auriscalpium vulgare]